jgi:hypothetical protein
MRNIAKAQPAGYAAYHDTAHMEEGDAPDRVNTKSSSPVVELVNTQDADGLPEWISGNEVLRVGLTRRPVLIGGADGGEEGAILREQSKLVVGGSSKMGKTWLMLDLALAVACGGKWLGLHQCQQARVLYVNLELHPDTAGSRIAWVGKQRNYLKGDSLRGYKFIEDVHADNFNAWHLRGHCYDLATMLETSRMRFKGGDKPFKLIVLDPIYKTYSGRDENSASEMASLMLSLEDFANEYQAAIAFAAHFSKGNQAGKEAVDRISGSGVMARDPDAIITFTPHEEEDHHVMEATLREFAPLPATVFRWEAPIAIPCIDKDPTKLKQAGKAAISKAPERAAAILEVLRANDGVMPRSDAIREAIKQAPPDPTTDNPEKAWEACLNRQPKAFADLGIEVISRGNGVTPLLSIKTNEKQPSKHPF